MRGGVGWKGRAGSVWSLLCASLCWSSGRGMASVAQCSMLGSRSGVSGNAIPCAELQRVCPVGFCRARQGLAVFREELIHMESCV